MKKLMIAAAIVCATAFAQAASVQWTFSEEAYNDPAAGSWYQDAKNLQGMTLYVFDSATWTAGKEAGGGYKADILTSALDHKALGAPGEGDFPAPYTSWIWSSDGTVANDSLVKGTSYALTYVISDGNNYQAMSGTQAAIAYDPNEASSVTPGALVISGMDAPFTNAGMTAFEGVPEPTSGLLLLLGVAGLALRRRRA